MISRRKQSSNSGDANAEYNHGQENSKFKYRILANRFALLLCVLTGGLFLVFNNVTRELNELNSCFEQLKELKRSRSADYKDVKSIKSRYDLKDLLLLPRYLEDKEVILEHTKKWSVDSDLYVKCGAAISKTHQPLQSYQNRCNIAIISSWSPRACGIATHSSKLADSIMNVCGSSSAVDIIAVRNSDEVEVVFPSVVKQSFAKDNLTEYLSVASFINSKQYTMVIIAYEFGLYGDERMLCLMNAIQNSYVVTVLHTLAADLPWQKQALTQQMILLSDRVSVMTQTMKRELMFLHKVPSSLISVIPHGVPIKVTPRKQNFLSDTSPSLFEADGANHVGRIKSGILPSQLRRSVGGGANRRNVVTAGSEDVPKQISSIATEGNRNSDSNSDSVGIGNRGHNKRKIIISNGLLHQGKGLEYAIQAMPAVLHEFPEVQYHILGTPHPTGTGTSEYYRRLQLIVEELHLQHSVIFNTSFFPDETLWVHLKESRVYINAYTDEMASVSGTLIMAMGFAVPCISTPYPFAKEMLEDSAGILVPFKDASAISKAILYLLGDEERARDIGMKGASQTVTWNDVAQKFLKLIGT